MGKKTQKKQEQEILQDMKWALRLASDKEKRKNVRELRTRNRTWEEVEALLDLPKDHEKYMLRSKESWRPKTYNLFRQVESYIQHLFVRFPLPRFMYQVFISPPKKVEEFKDIQNEYSRILRSLSMYHSSTVIESNALFFDWFITLAQGASFPKHVAGIMTKKEAFTFLSAPYKYITRNVWWARCTVRGMKHNVADALTDKVFYNTFVDCTSKDSQDIMDFFVKIQNDADLDLCSDLMDFLRAKLVTRTGKFTGFSLKGRTLASVVTLCNEWHEQIYHRDAEHRYKDQPFAEAGIKDWMFEAKFHIPWEISQIKNIKELRREGDKMKHCVLSYANYCATGMSYIFSVKEYGDRVITLELRAVPGTGRLKIIQARGRFNRAMKNEERQIVGRWARENNVQMIGDY